MASVLETPAKVNGGLAPKSRISPRLIRPGGSASSLVDGELVNRISITSRRGPPTADAPLMQEPSIDVDPSDANRDRT